MDPLILHRCDRPKKKKKCLHLDSEALNSCLHGRKSLKMWLVVRLLTWCWVLFCQESKFRNSVNRSLLACVTGAFYVVTVTPIGDGLMKWLGVVRQASRLPVSHNHLWPLGRSKFQEWGNLNRETYCIGFGASPFRH